MERWRNIKDKEGYQISNTGRVRSFINNRYGVGQISREIIPYTNERGYKSVHLGRGCRRSVHRLVAEAFIPNPKNLPLVRHLDDDPSNNRVKNLAWGTQTDNMQDCIKHGRLVGDTRAAVEAKRKPVIATSIETGERIKYESINAAALDLDLWSGHISSVLRGKISQTGGYRFEYVGEGDR